MTNTDIVNLALWLIGSNKITLLVEETKAAEIANDILPQCLKECIELEDWFFTRSRAKLPKFIAAPAFGTYTYQYSKPNGFCSLIATVNENDDEIEYPLSEEVFISGNIQTDVILCNEENVYIRFNVYRDDPNKMPAFFCRLVAARIAGYLAAPLRGGADNYTSFQIAKIWDSAYTDARAGNAKHNKRVEGYKDVETGRHDLLEASDEDIALG